MPQPVAPPPSAPEAVALEPLSAGASDVAASPQSYLPPATVEVTDPAPEVAFPVLPGEASAARLRLPKIERRRLMLFGITALMLLEALWLLRILR